MQGYANQCYPRDVYPYEIVGVAPSGSFIKVRAMDYKLSPDSPKRDFHPGGFFGHVSNLRDLIWLYSSNPGAPVRKAYLRKDGRYYLGGCRMSLSDKPHYFRDEND